MASMEEASDGEGERGTGERNGGVSREEVSTMEKAEARCGNFGKR